MRLIPCASGSGLASLNTRPQPSFRGTEGVDAESTLIQIDGFEGIRERSNERQEPPDSPIRCGDCTHRSRRRDRAGRQRPVREIAEGVAGWNSYRARVARHTSPGLQPATVRTGPSI